LLDEWILEVSVPKNVQDEVSLTLVSSVEAHIVFDSNFMQKVKNGLFGGVRKGTIRSAVGITAEVAVLHVPTDVLNSQLIGQLLQIEMFLFEAFLVLLCK